MTALIKGFNCFGTATICYAPNVTGVYFTLFIDISTLLVCFCCKTIFLLLGLKLPAPEDT